MAIYYNENGKLQNYETWGQVVVCPKCHKPYHQECEEQVPGFRDKDYDICPYCGNENGFSMSVEYKNIPMSLTEIAAYQANQ